MAERSVFCFVDSVSELKKNEGLTAFYTLRGDEEFLKDHFPGFPVMPGVLLLESLKQAAGRFLEGTFSLKESLFKLAAAEEVKFGRFVKPGSRLKIAVRYKGRDRDSHAFEGQIDVADGKALSAKLTLAPYKGVVS